MRKENFFKNLLGPLVGVLTLAPLLAAAEESSLSVDLALVSDYRFRGISQTDEKPALQAGVNWDSGMGFYATLWGSQVDFGTEADVELDGIVGYAGSLGDDWGYDIGLIHYNYPGESGLNFTEVFTHISFGDFSAGLNYSDEFGKDGPESYYSHVAYSTEFVETWTFTAQLAYTQSDAWDGYYKDWTLSLEKDFGPFSATVSWIGTDLDRRKTLGADSQLVLGVSTSF